jgi:hypothetical protein
MISRVVVRVVAVLLAAGALPASAQSLPSLPALPPAVQQIIQSLAGQAAAPYNVDPNEVRGVVTYFKRFDLQLRLPLNRYRDVKLHQGTIIDPRGTNLNDGDVVDVKCHPNADGTMEADVINLMHH